MKGRERERETDGERERKRERENHSRKRGLCPRSTKIKIQIGTLKRAKRAEQNRAEQRGEKRRETAEENLSKRQRINTHS